MNPTLLAETLLAETDHRYMRAALVHARRGLGETWPNPSVGCVIAREGRIVGAGRTAPGGRPHAEPQALADARARFGAAAAQGATVYVTLEPCAHYGRTPPCAQTLIDAGVARVVFACEDPDPRVDGRGASMLRAAGVAVKAGVCAEEAAISLNGFFTRIRLGRPFVRLKLATSLDGRIALASGESQWITGSAARRRAHLMRAQADAVMAGIGTILADDPRLTVRLPGLEARRPVRIAIDSRLRLPLESALVRNAAAHPVWVVHTEGADSTRAAALDLCGVRRIAVAPSSSSSLSTAGEGAGAGGSVDLAAALQALGAAGLTSVLCEGGGGLAAGLLAADLVDEIVWMSAGLAIGADGLPAVGTLGLERLPDARRWRLADVQTIGDRTGVDVMHTWRRSLESAAVDTLQG